TTPPVDTVSGVTSPTAGICSSTLSARPPLPVASKPMVAVPSTSVFDGQLTSAESPAAMVTVRVSGPLTVAPSAFSVTLTSDDGVVPLRTSARSSAESPTRRKRGSAGRTRSGWDDRSEEHTSELQSRVDLVCRLLLEKKKKRRRTV